MPKTQHSKRFDTVKKHYEAKVWNAARVEKAVELGWITAAEAEEIMSE